MNILFVSQVFPYPYYKDGATLRVFNILKELSKFNSVFLICLEPSNNINYDLFRSNLSINLPNVSLLYLASQSQLKSKYILTITQIYEKIRLKKYFSKSICRLIAAAHHSVGFDLVIYEQPYSFVYYRALRSVPCIASCVDSLSLDAISRLKATSFGLEYIKLCYLLLKRYAYELLYVSSLPTLTSVSEKDSRHLEKITHRSVITIPNGVDCSYFAPDINHHPRDSILYTGNLSSYMNQESAIYLINNIFPSIHLRFPHLKILIVGRNPTSSLLNLIPNYVSLHADVTDVRPFYSRSILSVHPGVYGSGIKNSALQSLAMGVPIVATSFIAKPIGITNGINGLIADRGNQFVDAVSRILLDCQLQNYIALNSREYVLRHFSWKSIADRYVKIATTPFDHHD